MNLISFIGSFPDEQTCRDRFKEFRDAEGVICRKCGSNEHYWLKTIESYQCKKCKTRTTLRSGTVMQDSNLPFRYWFLAIHFITGTKKSFSALELQRQIGHKYYEPVWYMLQKLRRTMGSSDSNYKLDRIVELEEGFFDTVDTESNQERRLKPKKRVRGIRKETSVMVMASTVHNHVKDKRPDKPGKTGIFRYVKMLVVENQSGRTVNKIMSENISSDSVVKAVRYSGIKDKICCGIPQKEKPKDTVKALPWVHIMLVNSKRTLLGVHHMVSKKYVQNYLDEFCYKTNRRYFGEKLFEQLLIACVSGNNEKMLLIPDSHIENLLST